eukprot:m.742624 g.742624  ORF g.742624 m.742624 type:complete len:130 (+) comp23120_c0_seq2:286-675(+)
MSMDASGNSIQSTSPSQDNQQGAQSSKKPKAGKKVPNAGKTSKPVKREMSDPEQRSKSLLRNRLAATRCREKKKLKMQELQQRVMQLTAANDQLKNEAAMLKDEIALSKDRLRSSGMQEYLIDVLMKQA